MAPNAAPEAMQKSAPEEDLLIAGASWQPEA
jgi:hypothetical protein